MSGQDVFETKGEETLQTNLRVADEHVDRIQFVDKHLRPQSLVNELPPIVRIKGALQWESCEAPSIAAHRREA